MRYGEQWQCPRAAAATTPPGSRARTTSASGARSCASASSVAYGIFFSAVAVFFIATGNAFSVFFLLPISLMAWFLLIRPVHRRRYREAIADLPRWDLRAE